MAVDPREGVLEFSGFQGLRNTTTPDRFELGDLEVATDCDIDDAKRIMRRRGWHQFAAGAWSNLYADDANILGIKDSTQLRRVNIDGTSITVRSGITPGPRMSYTSNVGRVYYSNGVQHGVIDGNSSRSWGLAVPSSQGDAAVIGGSLRPGAYQYAVVYVRSDGQFSGTGIAAKVDLSNYGLSTQKGPGLADIGPGLRIQNIPASSDPDVVAIDVYVSDVNGEMLYRRGRIANTAGSFTYPDAVPSQYALETQFLAPAPIGHLVMYAFGRTFVAVGSDLYYSEGYSPELFDYRKIIRFASRITVLAPAIDGMYVGTDTGVSWHPSRNPEEWVFLGKLAYGAVEGTLSFAPADWFTPGGDGNCTLFMTTYGLVVGMNGGNMRNLTQERFLFPQQARGSVVVRKYRGFNQALVVMQGTETAAPSAS